METAPLLGKNKSVGYCLIALGMAVIITLIAVITLVLVFTLASDAPYGYRIIDGHNDLPLAMRQLTCFNMSLYDLSKDNTEAKLTNSDWPRMFKGNYGAQFWSVYTSCADPDKMRQVQRAFELIDLLKLLYRQYPDELEAVHTSDDLKDALKHKDKIGGMMGVEGGNMIGDSMSILRLFYDAGVRYMSLTHTCTTDWAGSSSDGNVGLSSWGKQVIREMNRLGMIVDLSHTSMQTNADVYDTTMAPVMYSHSGAWEMCQHSRNVRDDMLMRLKENNGIIMINYWASLISRNCLPKNSTFSTAADVADHIEYIVNLHNSYDHVGLGSDFDGVGTDLPVDLYDTAQPPTLIRELEDRGWKEKELAKLTNLNLLRVFEEVEKVRDSLLHEEPYSTLRNCTPRIQRSMKAPNKL